MRARVTFAGLVAVSIVVIAGPASAKGDIAEASISGPGLGVRIQIDAPDTEDLWDSGIDVAGGLDDTRANSVEGLGLSPIGLGGPRYTVNYRFHGDDLIRQELYPYAEGGPVPYTPPGQEITVGINMAITHGWYRSSPGFLRYLVDQGLPERNPVIVATGGSAPPTGQEAPTAPWTGMMMLLVAFAVLSLATLAVRRRVRAMGRVTR